MKFTAYTFALSDFVTTGLTLALVGLALCLVSCWIANLFTPCVREFQEPDNNAAFDNREQFLSETGVAAEIAHLPPGSQLVEIDTAGLLTPPGAVMVHEYRWTGNRIEFVKTCPLHEFDFAVPRGQTSASAEVAPWQPVATREWPELKAAREEFFATAARLNLERRRFEAADPATL